ncbi:barstar family protein [Actinophytocola sp. NPDC049390]|uniref:barstar family protein n=1 Tax=Actinophytocola sp. NPDC049390 TaxID=3363894 RepID=UPI0037B14AF2
MAPLGADLRLLENGPVTLYHRHAVLDDTVATLAGLGYLIHRLDARAWGTRDAFAAAVKEELDFPDYFGGNLDAFNDCMRDVAAYAYGADRAAAGTAFVVTGYDAFAAADARAAQVVLDILADNARIGLLHGHRMICLVQPDDPDLRFDPVGATPVGWNRTESRH